MSLRHEEDTMKRIALALLLLAAPAAFPSPVITSITPRTGPVAGGTTVVIRGSGFSNNCVICSPPIGVAPTIYFGNLESPSVTFIDPTTLEAVTPPHIPGTVPVTITQMDGSNPNWFMFTEGFTYEGDVYEAYDPVLFPIFTPPVFGNGGSEFRTSAHAWNRNLDRPIPFYGFDTTCTLFDPPLSPENVFILQARSGQALTLYPECNQSEAPGRLFYIPKGETGFAGSLRVSERSQQSANHGVELPVVHREEFDEESIALVDVPIDPKFRLTLRVYGLNRGTDFVNVTFGGRLVQLPLHFSNNIFEPSYAVFTDFTPDPNVGGTLPERVNVLVDVPRGPAGAHIPGSPIWAFITVTNNETQHITTITPQH